MGGSSISREAMHAPVGPSPPVTQKILIEIARDKLGMDIENQYNFAVCGRTGTGKSTFINCIRGLDDIQCNDRFVYDIEGPAPVDTNEATRDVTRYRWPNNEYQFLMLWDLPGGGTIRHPMEEYFEKKVLYAFDCLLLLVSGRFTVLDSNIYQKALQYNIPVAIVMTKADSDVENRAKLKYGRNFRKLTKAEQKILIDETVQVLKNNAENELVRYGCPKPSNNSMFVIAAQSYRDQLRGMLDEDDCPPLETEKLFQSCCNVALYRRNSR